MTAKLRVAGGMMGKFKTWDDIWTWWPTIEPQAQIVLDLMQGRRDERAGAPGRASFADVLFIALVGLLGDREALAKPLAAMAPHVVHWRQALSAEPTHLPLDDVARLEAFVRCADYVGYPICEPLGADVLERAIEAHRGARQIVSRFEGDLAAAVANAVPARALGAFRNHRAPLPAFEPGQVPSMRPVDGESGWEQHMRYFCAARLAGASFADVEPAWRDYVRHFPVALSNQTWDFPQLLLWGGLVHAVLGEVPATEVASRVRQDIAEVAAGE